MLSTAKAETFSHHSTQKFNGFFSGEAKKEREQERKNGWKVKFPHLA
jgi:phage terminase large subunit